MPIVASASRSTCLSGWAGWNARPILLTADHGSEAADPDCRGDWDDALAAAGIAVRDEGYGALYL